jgi:UDPglucose 6-dehydrogenase
MIAQGTVANDFVNPPFIAFGAYSQGTGDAMRDFYLDFMKRSVLFNGKVPPNFVTTPEIAELAKLVANAFLSTKISFANMISQFCEANAIDSQMLLRIVGSDWRIGSAMLKPGYSFGGACFPRDLESLMLSFQRAGVDCPILDATRGVNFQRALDPVRIIETHKLGKRILVLGVAYKAGLKDTRGSASLSLINALRERGYQVTSFDPNIDTASFDNVMSSTVDVVIVTTPEPIFKSVGRLCRVAKVQAILDYANIVEDAVSETTRLYKAGLGWVN